MPSGALPTAAGRAAPGRAAPTIGGGGGPCGSRHARHFGLYVRMANAMPPTAVPGVWCGSAQVPRPSRRMGGAYRRCGGGVPVGAGRGPAGSHTWLPRGMGNGGVDVGAKNDDNTL